MSFHPFAFVRMVALLDKSWTLPGTLRCLKIYQPISLLNFSGLCQSTMYLPTNGGARGNAAYFELFDNPDQDFDYSTQASLLPYDIISISTAGASADLTASLDQLLHVLHQQHPSARHHNLNFNIDDHANFQQVQSKAEDLHRLLLNHRETSTTLTQIIFIAFNVGISIVKRALTIDASDTSKNRHALLQYTKCLIFHELSESGYQHQAKIYLSQTLTSQLKKACRAEHIHDSAYGSAASDQSSAKTFHVGLDKAFHHVLTVPLIEESTPQQHTTSQRSNLRQRLEHDATSNSPRTISHGESVQPIHPSEELPDTEHQKRQSTIATTTVCWKFGRHTTSETIGSCRQASSSLQSGISLLSSQEDAALSTSNTQQQAKRALHLWTKLLNVVKAVELIHAKSHGLQQRKGHFSDHHTLDSTKGLAFSRQPFTVDCLPVRVVDFGLTTFRPTELGPSTAVCRDLILEQLTGPIASTSQRLESCIDLADRLHRSPLALAAACGNVTAVSTLLLHGADPDLRDRSFGTSALGIAARYGHLRVVEALLANGTLADAGKGLVSQISLHAAIIGGGPHLAQELVERGASTSNEQLDCLPRNQRMWLQRILLMLGSSNAGKFVECPKDQDNTSPKATTSKTSSGNCKDSQKGIKRPADAEDPEDDQGKTPKRRKNKKTELEEPQVAEEEYLCHYFVVAPDRHDACRRRKWKKSELWRMKQHLRDSHFIHLCNACFLKVKDLHSLRAHTCVSDLQRNYVDGLDSYQLIDVQDRSKTWGKEGVEYWNEIWTILFPDRMGQTMPCPFASVTAQQLSDRLEQERLDCQRQELANFEVLRQGLARWANHERLHPDAIARMYAVFRAYGPDVPDELREVGTASPLQQRQQQGRDEQLADAVTMYQDRQDQVDDIPIDPELEQITGTIAGSSSRSPRSRDLIFNDDPEQRRTPEPQTPISSSQYLAVPPSSPEQQRRQLFPSSSASRSSASALLADLAESSNRRALRDHSSMSSIRTYSEPGSDFDKAIERYESGEHIE